MRGWQALFLASALFAGCLDGPETSDPARIEPGEAPEPTPDELAEPIGGGSYVEAVRVYWNGTLGLSAAACETESLRTCAFEEVVPADATGAFRDLAYVAAFDLILTWDAATPLTEDLVLEVSTKSDDPFCGWQPLGSAEGDSPLRFSKTDVVYRICLDNILQVEVRNPTIHAEEGPLTGDADVPQDVSLAGTLSLFHVYH